MELYFLILLCVIIILSYFYNYISSKIKVPSVILLILTGVFIKYIINATRFNFEIPMDILSVVGTLGLILIVFEGAIELELKHKKRKVINRAFFSASIQIILAALLIGLIIYLLTGTNFKNAIIYALPLSVISSAIAIPSAHILTNEKKEFITYESTMSDIIGIILFNFIVSNNVINLLNISGFAFSIVITLILSAVISILLLLMLNKIQLKAKLMFLLSLLVLLYASGKLLHLSSLILVLILGLVINNHHLITDKFKKFFNRELIEEDHKILKTITQEMSFLVRTLFFVIFGFSIDFGLIADFKTIYTGSLILLCIYFLRFFYLKLIIKSHLFPEIFIAPRGLITILLYYSIPIQYKIINFEDSIIVFVILVSSVLMAVGLITSNMSIIEENINKN
ncbi:MAG: hypothetical protein A2475_03075 [Ignavibacteria bacterium RIFOXYC2_FULL_35_21]|nr:MAG: hypothetical protein A2220_03890 [Ignavibacteria bacterium RIFOXYA2_FULL_35_10]OGV23636.1 MAG: hypothetical protein A2475_03075 [Ignavibacteria bacterium RIFOXYC2_FULL_35_21]